MAAEDIASEALIKLWEKLKAEPVEEKYILPLLLTILKNKALDYLKHEEVKRSAFEVMADWQQQELSIRMSALEACNPDEIFRKKWKNHQCYFKYLVGTDATSIYFEPF